MKSTRMRKGKGYLFRTRSRESQYYLSFGSDSKASGEEKLCSEKRGRLQVCPDWR